jgi:hypothetical protein
MLRETIGRDAKRKAETLAQELFREQAIKTLDQILTIA